MKFEEKLITLRKSRGMSQEDLAEKLEVSRQAISRWELGSTMPDVPNLKQLSELFGVSSDYLINDNYSSDADIPSVKEKNEEVINMKIMKRNLHLISGICFMIGTCGSVAGIFASSNSNQLIISVFCTLFSFATAVAQFVLYIRK